MHELLYTKLIVTLLENETPLTRIPQYELENLLRIRPDGQPDINTVDLMYQSILDELTSKYGLLGTLTRLDTLVKEVLELERKNAGNAYGFKLYLLKIAIKNLYVRVEPYYIPELSFKMSVAFSKLQDGTFDVEHFCKNVLESSHQIESDEPVLLIEQMNFLNLEPVTYTTRMDKLYRAIKSKNARTKESYSNIRTHFTNDELSEYAIYLTDLLSTKLTPEHRIIVKTFLKICDRVSKMPYPEKQSVDDSCDFKNYTIAKMTD